MSMVVSMMTVSMVVLMDHGVPLISSPSPGPGGM